jgi:hypothetical protein
MSLLRWNSDLSLSVGGLHFSFKVRVRTLHGKFGLTSREVCVLFYGYNVGTTVICQNVIQEKIKRRLISGNACHHSVRKFLSLRLMSKNVKIRIFKTIILPVVLYWCRTWSLILREEHILRMFEYRLLRRIFWPRRDEMTGGWRKLHKELYNLTLRQVKFEWLSQRGLNGQGI